MKVIAFTGKMESGKTTAATTIQNSLDYRKYFVKRLAFAGSFKKIALDYFGFTQSELYTPEGKANVNEFWGMTPREFLQRFGQGMRDAICEDVWVKVLKQKLLKVKYEEFMDDEDLEPVEYVVLIDDLRQDNEAEMLKKDFDAIIVDVVRPEHHAVSEGIVNHPSEQGIDRKYIDYILENTSSLANFYDKIGNFLKNQKLI